MGLSNEEKVKLLRLIESYVMYHDMAKTSFEKAITSLINFENQQKNIPWDSWNINNKAYNMHNAKSLSNVVSPDILNAYSQLHLFINKVSVSFKLLKSILNFPPEGREYSYFADKIEDSAKFKSLKKSNNKLNSIVNDARNKIQHRDEEIL